MNMNIPGLLLVQTPSSIGYLLILVPGQGMASLLLDEVESWGILLVYCSKSLWQ